MARKVGMTLMLTVKTVLPAERGAEENVKRKTCFFIEATLARQGSPQILRMGIPAVICWKATSQSRKRGADGPSC
jgi:hypothetical protein